MAAAAGGTSADVDERRSLLRRRSSFWLQPAQGGALVDDLADSNLEANKLPDRRDLGAPASVDLQVLPVLLCCVILSGVLRFHMQACRAELVEPAGRAAATGTCHHPVAVWLSAGHMQDWMADARTAAVAEEFVTYLPIGLSIGAASLYGVQVWGTATWDSSRVFAYQLVGLVTGILAGLVGIGGGVILCPFFLLTGMEPAVCVGTSSTCVFFTSLSTAMQYVFTDRVHMSLALVYSSATLTAALTGTSTLHWLSDRFVGNTSLISLALVLALALSFGLSLMKAVEGYM